MFPAGDYRSLNIDKGGHPNSSFEKILGPVQVKDRGGVSEVTGYRDRMVSWTNRPPDPGMSSAADFGWAYKLTNPNPDCGRELRVGGSRTDGAARGALGGAS